jgi:UDP-glucose 4-epimerase
MKLASERLIQTLFSSEAVAKVLIARFPNVTGVRQTHGVVKDLVYKYFDNSQRWEILGDGFQEKPYIHVRELVEIIIRVEAGLEPQSLLQLNVAPDTTSTVRSIVEEIENRANKNRTPHFGTTSHGWIGDIPKYEFDTLKLRSLGIQVSSSSDAIAKSVREEVASYID